jgi:hypothetical protein
MASKFIDEVKLVLLQSGFVRKLSLPQELYEVKKVKLFSQSFDTFLVPGTS